MGILSCTLPWVFKIIHEVEIIIIINFNLLFYIFENWELLEFTEHLITIAFLMTPFSYITPFGIKTMGNCWLYHWRVCLEEQIIIHKNSINNNLILTYKQWVPEILLYKRDIFTLWLLNLGIQKSCKNARRELKMIHTLLP